MEISELREQIDAIDNELVRLANFLQIPLEYTCLEDFDQKRKTIKWNL
jgi:hypothetical protein